jgi:PQQ-dependent catabolism-associated CXXCW motif protein
MIRAAVFVALLCCGVAVAAVPEPTGFRTDDYHGPVPDTVAGGVVVHAAQIQALQQRGAVVLIDVVTAPRRPATMRPGAPWLPPVHRDLLGSLWWPDTGRGEISPDLAERLHGRLTAVEATHPGALIVFYCHSDCWLSWNATKRAAAWGIHAGWYPDGADGWEHDGLPMQDATPDFLD